jgi:HSP20 family protein
MALPVRRNSDAVTRWDPFAELDRINQRLQSYLEPWRDFPSLTGDGFTPLADVEEADDAYLVEVELPGIAKGDVSIEIAGRRLTVSGERKEKERVGILRRRTRSTGRFYYEVLLPGEVDDSGVEAYLEEGVLTVRVPKAASERPRRIEIR